MNDNLHRIRIDSQKVGDFQVFIDGKQIYGVTKVSLDLVSGRLPGVKLEFVPQSIETNELPFLVREPSTTEDGESG